MKDPLPSDIFHRGQVLNNTYDIEGVLGRGGTGEVYLARNQISGREVAIKALSAQFSGNADYVELMKREEEMRNIQHDAVVRYTECSRSDQGHVFLVMDYIDGPSMNDEMLARRMDAHDLMVIAHRVASGLVATHARGVVHRDLSPDNIILRGGAPEKATIIDFGIAKDTAAGARTIVGNQFAGKYEYAAPEQVEGHAEPRSDLYALGASLLAAWRGEVPFLGNTPGEIVRRKQQRLDTEGVPEPLKGLIDALTAPELADRPADAAAVVARIEAALKPRTGVTETAPSGRRGRRGAWLALPALAVVAGVAAWMLGLFDGLFPEPLPVAAPYRLAASHGPDAPGRLVGNAPDEAAATALAAAYAEAAGTAPAEAALTLATGLPRADWAAQAAALMAELAPLDRWEMSLAGSSGEVTGLAPDSAARDAVRARIDAWSATSGITLSAAIAAGPERLDAAQVQAVLDRRATCGPLTQQTPSDATYPMGATIVVTGDIAAQADKPAIEAALVPLIGDRQVQVETRTLNRDLCAIRAVLPHPGGGTLSIWLGQGETGEANLTGIYRVGENPVAEVLAPASLTQGWLWVMVVDNTGKVFHVLPQINHTEHALTEVGRVEGGLRRVRVLHSVEEFRADPGRLAFRITDGDFGKSEIIAILSKTPLFDMRRPRDESVTSVAEALAETLEGREDQVLGVASRIIDARQ
ncbi:serine/threonine protein kinase [Rhodovulum euryhalinum]|uniref:Serine/threonine protein kinase n=1 Tax=Rhodovulum euryhalinum TaxID=35805 RepID=A0A4R2KIZ7_9RHOB|nr:serine/threonine protein kinase [Rhodovulum euryhalinum]TCO70536.1 serine/threonine protein kinase [Rhodovulum euryhalinum]